LLRGIAGTHETIRSGIDFFRIPEKPEEASAINSIRRIVFFILALLVSAKLMA